jgi:hypothetical protein
VADRSYLCKGQHKKPAGMAAEDLTVTATNFFVICDPQNYFAAGKSGI